MPTSCVGFLANRNMRRLLSYGVSVSVIKGMASRSVCRASAVFPFAGDHATAPGGEPFSNVDPVHIRGKPGAFLRPARMCRESQACYAFLVGDSEELQETWLKRNSTPEALKSCRKAFRSAVKSTAKRIQAKSWAGANTESWICHAYDQAIDFGAHPNPKGVWPCVRTSEDHSDGYHRVAMVGVYEPDSFETSRCLMACPDFGLLIALILTSCRDEPTEEAVSALNQLNELKEELTKTCFPNHIPA